MKLRELEERVGTARGVPLMASTSAARIAKLEQLLVVAGTLHLI